MKRIINYIALAFSALLILVDQVIKLLAIEYLSPIVTKPVIENVLHLTYLENRGAAFGILNGRGLLLSIFTFIVLAALIVIILIGKVKSKILLWSLAAVIGGGIGNLIDRVFRGFVVDYIEVKFVQFAVFNFADCCIVVGTILIMIYIIFVEWRSKPKKASENIEDDKKAVSDE